MEPPKMTPVNTFGETRGLLEGFIFRILEGVWEREAGKHGSCSHSHSGDLGEEPRTSE